MQIKSTSQVRAHFQDIVDRVHYTKIPLIISKNKKPWVMIQPLPEGDVDLQALIEEKQSKEK